MAFDRLRHGRQSRLPEIGETGQARLCEAKIALRSEGFARTIEERYVRGFGASPIAPEHGDIGGALLAGVEMLGIEHEAAREVGQGALDALVALKAILDEGRRGGG